VQLHMYLRHQKAFWESSSHQSFTLQPSLQQSDNGLLFEKFPIEV